MRIWIVAGAVLMLAGPLFGQYQSADYDLERWNEDFSYLRYPGSHTDFFDPIKYVPLNANGSNYLSFGGQARYRFDYFNNSDFGAGTQDETGFDLLRFLVHADANFGEHFRAFVQLDSSQLYDRAGGPRPGDTKDFDVQQAFVDLDLLIDDAENLMLRMGRQELVYGAQRLISPSDWANVRRSFEGVRASWTMPNDTLDGFVVRPVLVEKSHFDSGDDHSTFAGIYNVASFDDLLPKTNTKLDTYLLLLNQGRSQTTGYDANSNTFTLGIRPHARPGNWDLDLEADWQFGQYNSSEIDAYSVAIEAGYTFNQMKFTPRAAIGLDVASGSPNPAHRFNQLFPPLYTYLGHLYLFGRENIIDLHPEWAMNLMDGVTLSMADHVFWRENIRDALYSQTGELVRASDGSRARFVGDEIDVTLSWQVDRHLLLYTGWAHLFTGPFIHNTGPHSDPDFFYAMATYTF